MPDAEQELFDSHLMFTWLCSVAQASSPHMDGTFEWRIPSHVLPRAHSFRESVSRAIQKAKNNLYDDPPEGGEW